MAKTFRIDWTKRVNDNLIALGKLMRHRGIIAESQYFTLAESEDGFYLLLKDKDSDWFRTSAIISNDRIRAAMWLVGYVSAAYALMGDEPGHEFWRS